ncbi:hypothetical protein E1B28_002242 [Marasmius oreades]|uniref:F-box domain-containing protein n=1 Tax=Marasmius oreades TaxID=181124 RepID=A0A9P7RNR1_9AGAR|nr:uncharacterized protein E1B28_002242 [Marasmius oreades]KAG7086278.1 hypothetical protein E1B28_002242 [Marasmius oreades]
MTHLLDLPNEILCAIGSQVPAKSLKQLRLCNTRLKEALTPVLFASVVLGITPASTHISTAFNRYVKHLSIGSWRGHTKPDLTALNYLQNVRSVRWQLAGTESEQLVTKIFEYLYNLPYLSELHFSSYHSSSFPIPFDHYPIRNLSVLSVQGPFCGDSHSVTPALFRLITNNPSLTSMSLDVAWSPNPLHSNHLFDSLPPDSFLCLRHLRLPRWHVNISSACIRMMPALSSLDVTLLPPTGINNNVLWALLQEEGIHLKDLAVTVVSQELLDYLQSYSGLETLVLSDVESDRNLHTSDQFYQRVLPKHSQTLVSLSVDARNTQEWCLTRKNAAALQECQELKNLSVSVKSMVVETLLSFAPRSLRSLSLTWNATLADGFRTFFVKMYDSDLIGEPYTSSQTLVVYADIVYLLGRIDKSGFVFRGYKTHHSELNWTAASCLHRGV